MLESALPAPGPRARRRREVGFRVGETFDLAHTRAGSTGPVSLRPGRDERLDVETLLVSFGLVFVAELGDKSQLMALTFATRYRPAQVLAGITVAAAVVHLASVAVGAAFAASLPTTVVGVVAGISFFGFAAWTLRGDDLSDEERAGARRPAGSAVVAVATAFFLAELGDKTMLATVTLAATGDAVGTWLGATLGTVVADALAIAVGGVAGTRLPERAVNRFAAASFVAFGVALLVGAVRGG